MVDFLKTAWLGFLSLIGMRKTAQDLAADRIILNSGAVNDLAYKLVERLEERVNELEKREDDCQKRSDEQRDQIRALQDQNYQLTRQVTDLRLEVGKLTAELKVVSDSAK